MQLYHRAHPLVVIWRTSLKKQIAERMDDNKQFPLVSIVMATYNGERFLEAQMNSVLKQSYPSLEIIVVDDGSTDGTAAILQSYAKNYHYIRLYFSEGKNLGYIKNFERGCQLATGDYISFCDQDDIWHPDKTNILMNAIGNHPMVYGDDELVDGQL